MEIGIYFIIITIALLLVLSIVIKLLKQDSNLDIFNKIIAFHTSIVGYTCVFTFTYTKVWKMILFIISVFYSKDFILSSFEGVYSFFVVVEDFENWLLFIFAYAWFSYIVMGLFWALEVRLGKFLPITGTVAGGISVGIISIFIFPLIFVIVQVLLAIWFCRYHYSHRWFSFERSIPFSIPNKMR